MSARGQVHGTQMHDSSAARRTLLLLTSLPFTSCGLRPTSRSLHRRAVSAGVLSALVAAAPPLPAAAKPELTVPEVVYKDNAVEGDIGTRPSIFGVPGGVIYFGCAASLQASLLLSGKQGTVMINGTAFKDGKEIAQRLCPNAFPDVASSAFVTHCYHAD